MSSLFDANLTAASKEWVIAPKPKPGRKPKKDLSAPAKPEADAFYRAAQRAFRERKQSQLAELQARVQSYEQGEIERNVALQHIAKRLKEENEALRAENYLLKEKLVKSGLAPPTHTDNEKKRLSRDDTLISIPSSKRAKATIGHPSTNAPLTLSLSFSHSPPSTVSSPDSSGSSDNTCSPLPSYDLQPDSLHSHLMDFPSTKPSQDDGTCFPTFDCGFCSEDTPCMCRELVTQQVAHTTNYNPVNLPSILQSSNNIQLNTAPTPSSGCILENLPPYQPPVPLRRRPASSNVNTVFTVAPPPPQVLPANCSGDPSNCMACADDAFGKAFCLAIEESVASRVPCADCPCSSDLTSLSCDQPSAPDCCGRDASQCNCRNSASFGSYPNPLSEGSNPETMPTNDAWRQIKSHPNVSFTDLTLLAEVVARRSKCTGPRVVIEPALGSITPERITSPPAVNLPIEQDPIVLTDPHAHYREKERTRSSGASSSPRLVPQDVLIKCGRQRVREVQTDAVRAALRLLDAKFT
ncbi:hypothetical protein H0H87_003810 [Tephrocybe sp. NHM501043]|nr:hypothetical protein H0H87_003810 [Tephrocybe sp. NHM501043]